MVPRIRQQVASNGGVDFDLVQQAIRTFPLAWTSVTGRHRHGFSVLGSKKLAIRIFLLQFAQQSLRKGSLMFTAGGKCKDDLSERLQIPAVFGGLSVLFHAKVFIAVDPAKPECEAGTGVAPPTPGALL